MAAEVEGEPIGMRSRVFATMGYAAAKIGAHRLRVR